MKLRFSTSPKLQRSVAQPHTYLSSIVKQASQLEGSNVFPAAIIFHSSSFPFLSFPFLPRERGYLVYSFCAFPALDLPSRASRRRSLNPSLSTSMSALTETSPLLPGPAEPAAGASPDLHEEANDPTPPLAPNILRAIKILQILLFTSSIATGVVAIAADVVSRISTVRWTGYLEPFHSVVCFILIRFQTTFCSHTQTSHRYSLPLYSPASI